MPSTILAAIDANRTEDRSAYLTKLAVADLEHRGVLPGTPAYEVREQAEALAAEMGQKQAAEAIKALRLRCA